MRYFKLNTFLAIVCLLCCNGLMAQTDSTKKVTQDPKTLVKEFSYAYGYSFAKDLKEKSTFDANELATKEILKGLKAGLEPDTSALNKTNTFLDERLQEKQDSIKASDAVAKQTAYHIGYSAVANLIVTLEVTGKDFNYGSLKKGYMDYINEKKAPYSQEEMDGKLTSYFQEKQIALQEKALAKRKAEGEKNLAAGKKYLEENAKKEGIKVTESGLQYQVIKEGTGPKATLENTVVTHYSGTFMDGKVFDSSIERGQPAKFVLKNVIEGWQEGIQLMNAGARYRLFVPSELAYGENSPPSIPVNSVLIFDVELLDILEETDDLEDAKVKLSYSYGYMIGQSLGRVGFEPNEKDPVQFVEGFRNGFTAASEDVKIIETFMQFRMQTGKADTSIREQKKVAYGIGFSSSAGVSTQLGAKGEDFELNAIGLGYATAIDGKESMLSDEEMSEVLKAYFEPKQMAMKEAQQAKQTADALANIKAGKAFMEENAKVEGVQVMENGMQYIVLKEGNGIRPTKDDKVTTHYHGMLINGSVFDSSVDRGEPATFPLRNVIQGWQDGIPLMSVGAKYKFFIPPGLAYGNRAMGESIPAGSTLIFEVELIKIGD